ncbi:MAG: hypothetical protein MUO40_03795 [Anaerolineaceae bacterium]|nr:hypothetical protein [Anaerolineaceae bacterium]
MKNKYLAKIPLVIGSIVLLVSAVMLSWRLIPPERIEQKLTILDGRLAASPEGMDIILSRDINLQLQYPSKLRAGEKTKLWLEVAASESEDGVDLEATMPPGISAELTLLSVVQTPQGLITTGFDSTHPISFSWELQASEVGQREGSLWVTLDFVDPDGEKVEVPVAAMSVRTEVVRLWGLDASVVLWLAFAGLLLWGGMMLIGLKLEYTSRTQK